ncbi:putative protein N(5)-glutamine methyltransferase [Shimazuella sp. AN120528]|uniref:putative protein N(5)-glutamine methyltransferase n=1 Tax=Shimazuella soli TaxID=1892854 RepID=UPI001F0E71A3|nr:putative protein N(5)-glutamine methyltransferase [Shimazuella soli]
MPTVAAQLRNAGCVFAEEEAKLLLEAAQDESGLIKMVQQRASGLPIEHVIGWSEFCGHRIAVDKGVFVPRKRTEFLVEQAVKLAKNGDIILDLCCGSGALGIVVAASLDEYQLYASDLDPKAVQCARKNVTPVGGKVYEGDLFSPLPDYLQGRVNILLANTPYVPTDAIEFLPAEAREYEAWMALDGGEDGLEIQRRVASVAPLWLAPNGLLFVESSEQQALQTAEIFIQNELHPQIVRCNDLDATVVIGMKKENEIRVKKPT